MRAARAPCQRCVRRRRRWSIGGARHRVGHPVSADRRRRRPAAAMRSHDPHQHLGQRGGRAQTQRCLPPSPEQRRTTGCTVSRPPRDIRGVLALFAATSAALVPDAKDARTFWPSLASRRVRVDVARVLRANGRRGPPCVYDSAAVQAQLETVYPSNRLSSARVGLSRRLVLRPRNGGTMGLPARMRPTFR